MPFLRLDDGVELRQLNPAPGNSLCVYNVQDAAGLGPRAWSANPDGNLIVTGTDVGRLSGLNTVCDSPSVAWSASPVETGSRFSLSVEPTSTVLEGPIVVKVTLSVQVAGVGNVELYWLGHVVRAEKDIPVWVVFLRAHLHLWY